MSRINTFAVLDDSDDEKLVAPKAIATKKGNTANNSNVAKPESSGGNKARRNPNNDRNTKGGRGPRKARDGKRTYDRRSGTGRGKEIKKGGGGGHNWGSDKNEAKSGEGELDENELNKEAAAGNDGDEAVLDAAAEPEQEQKTLTLEEYLSAKTESVSLFGPSNGEKQVDNEFEGKNARVAVEEDFLGATGGKSLRKKAGKDKVVQKLDLNFRVKGDGDEDKPRRGDRRDGGRGGDRQNNERRKGGRGGGRGGGRRSGGRGGNFALDSNAFPSL